MDREESQFSIYKINFDKFGEIRGLNDDQDPHLANNTLEFMLSEIKKQINKKEEQNVWNVDKDELKGLIYRTANHPNWEKMARNLLAENPQDADNILLSNINTSYILFYLINGNIYAMTAGYGSTLIKDYIEKNWGLHLIPKMFYEKDGVIKVVKENNLYGNEAAVSKANRRNTNFFMEKELKSIFSEMSIEAGQEIADLLGIKPAKDNSKIKMNIISKDSLCIRKSITIEQLKVIIRNIVNIEKRDDNFSLGYFVTVNKIGLKNSVLFRELAQNFINLYKENFEIVGGDYIDYCISSSQYIIQDEKNEDFIETPEPIKLAELFESIQQQKKISTAFIERFLSKWTLTTLDENGVSIVNQRNIKSSIQGCMNYGTKNILCYLFEGEWYCMEDKYSEELKKRFEDIYDECIVPANVLKEKYNLCNNSDNENKYNISFYGDSKVLVAHKQEISNVEIADLIFWDDKNVYLMCNKWHFDANGSRDLMNQMYASSYLLNQKIKSTNRQQFFKDLYKKIEKEYKKRSFPIPIGEKEFISLFINKKICYIAGYVAGYKKDTKSFYAKYLSVDLYQKMNSMNYECIFMGIE